MGLRLDGVIKGREEKIRVKKMKEKDGVSCRRETNFQGRNEVKSNREKILTKILKKKTQWKGGKAFGLSVLLNDHSKLSSPTSQIFSLTYPARLSSIYRGVIPRHFLFVWLHGTRM